MHWAIQAWFAHVAVHCNRSRYPQRLLSLQEEQAGRIDNELAVVLSSVAVACKQIASMVNRAGISNLTGLQGDQNSSGEDQKKLDVVSNTVFSNCLRASGRTVSRISIARAIYRSMLCTWQAEADHIPSGKHDVRLSVPHNCSADVAGKVITMSVFNFQVIPTRTHALGTAQ